MTNLINEIWQRKSLIILFAINDVKLRYKNSILGFIWSFLEPLLLLSVLYFVFTNVIKNDIENYPLYLLLSLILWYMFSRATTMGQSSLLDRSGIIQKIYFRREIFVISSCLTAFIMMIFEFFAFAIFAIALKFTPPITVLLLPLFLIDLLVLSIGMSLMLSVTSVYFRDVKFIWQILLQAGFFLSPIIYKLDMFPDNIQTILRFNPMVTILESTHNVVLYGILPDTTSIFYVFGTTLTILFIGYIIFRIKDKKLIEEL